MPGRVRRAAVVKATVLVAVVGTLAALLGVVAPPAADAAGTVLFQNLFNNRTVDGTGTVTVPTPTSGTNAACLTASGNSATLPLLSCAGTADAQGSGKLRLTSSAGNQVGGVFGQSSFPTSNGLDVTFTAYQWGGGGADGMSFLLAAVDPANPAAPAAIGPGGGSLGYSPAGSVRGLPNAYLGVGLDVYGNYSSNSFSGSGCTNPAPISAPAPGAVVVRGPGNGLVGYCGLTSTYDGTAGSKVTLRAATRAAAGVPVQVLVNPTTAAFTSDTGVSVAAGFYKVVVTPVGQATRTLTARLPAVAAGLYPSSGWLNAGGVPRQLAFGFVGATGSITDVHEISAVKVLTFNPVSQLAVATTSYAPATSQPGQPVNYTVDARVLAGANVNNPITMTQTVPAGVTPVGAYGAGWTCQARVGQTITCVTSATSFLSGAVLPTITVVGIVTAANLSATVVQSSSPTRVSAPDASPGTDATTTAGAVPAAPTGFTVSPAIGPVTGGGVVLLAGSSTVAPTAIEIGTAAEQQAGTPVVLLPCPAGRAVGCFAIEGTNVVIQSMPARAAAATVTVTVVTLGVAATTTYVYASAPGVPATPTATAGLSSATVTWAPPAANGSPVTGYVVSTYRAGVFLQAQTFDATTTTRTLSGLIPGSSHTFTVAATNAYGTSSPSPLSAAAVPYALPGAPVVTAATAGSQAAVLTWTTPAANGSAITAYVVTPYIGTVAQPTQTFAGAATTRTVTGLTPGTSYTFRVAAQNVAGTGPLSAASAAVTPNVSPGLVFAAPPSGEVAVAYSAQLTVTNGTAPFTWAVSSGTLPAGLTLAPSTGLLAGVPTTAGTSTFTVQVTDASGQTATRSVTLVIAAVPVMTFTPAEGEVGVAYSEQPTIAGGTGPFAWTVSGGTLPAGLTLDPSTGLLSGAPTAPGSAGVTITATDAFGQAAARTVTLVIVARPAFATTAPPTGQVGVAYSHRFDVTGGSQPLTWAITAGVVPAGLTFDPATGVLSGTPTAVGASPVTVRVTDAKAQTAVRSVTLTVTAGPLVITKTANASSAQPGAVVRYTITVANTGTAGFPAVTLSDPLGAVLDDATYNADVTASGGAATYTAPTLGWTGAVAAGATVTIGYSVTVRTPDLGNKVLVNTVTSPTLGANCAAGSADARCTTTVTVPGITIVKSSDVSVTTPGSRVRFTIVVTNAGQTAYPSAGLTDDLAGVLDDAAYTGDATTTAGSVVYAAPSLIWTGPLAIGASVTISYTVTVNDPDLGNRSLAGTVVSSSAGSPCPGGNPAPQCSVAVTVLVPALSIAIVADRATTTPGGRVAYTATLANTGQTAYTAATVTVALGGVLDDATDNGDVVVTGGSIAFDAGSASLVWTGDLAVGAAVTISASVTVRDPDPGDRTLTATATSAARGSTCATGANPGCTSVVQIRLPGLAITTRADAATTTPGSVVGFTVSATNTGQTPHVQAGFRQELAAALDDATYAGDASVGQGPGSVSVDGTTLTWTGDLAIGATVTVRYTMTVREPATGDRALRSTVTSATPGANCAVGSVDPRCSSTVTVLLPGLSVQATTDGSTATPGGIVRYSITVTNTGQTSYTGLALTLDLAQALDDADYNYDALISAGNLITSPNGHVDWVLALAPGGSATGSLSFTVKNPATGDRALRMSVVADAPGSPCPTGSADEACSTVVTVLIPGLTITKTADTSTVRPGGTVGYTITVVNDGEAAIPAARIADDLTKVLTDAVYAGDATATAGTLGYQNAVLSWTGPLAVDASVTIGYTVTVRDPDPGDKTMLNVVTSPDAGSNCPAGGADPRCFAVVQVLVPALTVVTTATTPTTEPGAVVGHTVTITNSGATPFPAASITASLAGVLDDATYNGDAASGGVGTAGVDGTNLTWSGPLAIGATAVVTYSVTVRLADIGDDRLTSVVTSTAYGANCPVAGADPRCAVTVPVARLVVWQRVGAPTVTPGSLISVSATFTNTGEVPYVGIAVATAPSDTSDDVAATGDQTASSGTLALTPTGVLWTGDIAVGGVVTLAATLLVKDPALGDGIVVLSLESSAPGSTCPPGGPDSRCTVRVDILVPELTITKTADSTWAAPGDVVTYTITVHNSGETAYTGATLSDALVGDLDNGTYDGNATASIGSVAYTSPTLSWTGNLAVGETAVISYSVTVDVVPAGDLTLFNAVTSSTKGSTCPPGSGNPACLSNVVLLSPMLTISKTANPAAATLGAVVTYTITATNAGQTPYAPAELTDDMAGVLDDAVYNEDAVADTGTLDHTDGVLSWSGPLAPGAAVTITYSVTIANPSTGDLVMVDTVSSTSDGSNCAEGSVDARCVTSVPIVDAVSVTFTKTADVRTTVRGGVVTYTVTVANSTVSPLADVTFTDPLAGVLDDATYNGDATADAGTVTLIGSDLVWTGTAPALGSVTVSYSVTVNATETGDQFLEGTVRSATLPGSDNCEVASVDPRCASTVPIAALRIEQSAGAPTATPGSIVTLTATYTNTGEVPYYGVSIVSPRLDTSDDTVPTGDLSTSSGVVVRTPTAVIWTGDIPVGATVTMLRTLRVQDPDPGNLRIAATTESTAPGNNCQNGATDPLCSFLVTVLVPELTIAKTSNVPVTVPGSTVSFTVTIDNTGDTPYTAAEVTDSLAGVLDDATYDGNAAADIGSVTFSTPALTWTGDLAVGEVATLTYSVTVRQAAAGDKTMVNSVGSATQGNTCPAASRNAACRSIVAVLTPSLVVRASAGVADTEPGATVTHTIVATNAGQVPYTGAVVTVGLGDVLDDASLDGAASATAGAVEISGDTLTWTGDLAQTASVTITYAVTVDEPVTGDFRLDQTVVSNVQGSTCPTAGADPRCATSTPIASLRIDNAADVATTEPTAVVRNTVTFTNTGQVPYVGLVINDDFVGALDDGDYNGDATADVGSLLLVADIGRVVWTGDLGVGETVVLSGSLTVRNPASGDKVLTTAVSTSAAGSNCPVGSADPACRTTVPVLTPELTIAKAVDAVVVTPGTTVGYTVTITNTGETAYPAASVTDRLVGVLDDAAYNDDAVVVGGGALSYTAPNLTWTGPLAVGATVVLTYSVRVGDPDLGDKALVNDVMSNAIGSTCPVSGAVSPCFAVTLVLVPALDVSVVADRTTTVPGGSVGYTLTVRNTGQTDYTGLRVSALLAGVLDDATYDGDALPTAGAVEFDGAELAWTGDLAIGAVVIVTYGVTVDDPDVGDLALVTAVQSAAQGSPCGSVVPCVGTVTVLVPGLTVTTTADVATATPGDAVTFTITLVNTGQTPYPEATLSTTLAGVLDDAEFDGEITASAGLPSYSAPTLSWSGGLRPGESAVIAYTVVVRDPAPGDRLLSTTVVAPGSGSTCAAGADPACTATVAVLIPGLTIGKSAGAPTTTPGSVVGYRIVIANTGETPYDDAVVSDSLDLVLTDAEYNGDAVVTAGGGTLGYVDSTIVWQGDLLVGASATITYSVTVRDPDPGDKILRNAAVSDEAGSTCPTGSTATACAATVRVLVPALLVTKTVDAATVVAGGAVGYTVTVTNTGETPYAPAVLTDSLTDVLDDATWADDAVASSGDVAFAGDTMTWTGALPVGATATITYSVTTAFPAIGDRMLANAVLSPSPGASCATGTEPRCATAVPVLRPGLTVTKTADTSTVVAGETVRYTITATNTGQADYPAAGFVDTLAGVLDDAAYNGDATATAGVVQQVGDTLVWTGALARGATVLVTYSVTSDVVGSGDAVLLNLVSSTTVGSTCPAAGAACATATAIAARSISLTNPTGSFTLNGLPDATVGKDNAVTMTVTTNSSGGYVVTVVAIDPWLTPGSATNPMRIPIARLGVRENGRQAFQPLSVNVPRVVHQQRTPSAPAGDAVSSDYQIKIPFAPSDTYTTTLEYIVSAQ